MILSFWEVFLGIFLILNTSLGPLFEIFRGGPGVKDFHVFFIDFLLTGTPGTGMNLMVKRPGRE